MTASVATSSQEPHPTANKSFPERIAIARRMASLGFTLEEIALAMQHSPDFVAAAIRTEPLAPPTGPPSEATKPMSTEAEGNTP
jgi:hypothetical protein